MAMREEFEKVGNWLFRWRSYLPFFLIGLFLFALISFRYPVDSHGWDQAWETICLCISFFGLTVRGYVIGCVPRGTSGRNVKEQRAEVLNTTGMYSLVRHPLYLGNFLIWLGIILSIRLWWFITVTVLFFWLYYEKIIFAEEEFLRRKFGDTFLKWADKTPPFFPVKLKLWRPPELPFRFKNVLRKEYSGFFAIISAFTALEVVEERVVEGRFQLDTMWTAIFSVGLVVYLTVMILKKKTKLLDAEGR